MSKRHSKEHARRKRISRLNGTTEKIKGSAVHHVWSQAHLTRAQAAWRRTNDPRTAAIKFKEFCTARPDENPDYIPVAWRTFTDRLIAINRVVERVNEEEEQAVQETVVETPVKKTRKPRAKKETAQETTQA